MLIIHMNLGTCFFSVPPSNNVIPQHRINIPVFNDYSCIKPRTETTATVMDNGDSDGDSVGGGVPLAFMDQVRHLRIGGEPQESKDNMAALELHLDALPAELKIKILQFLSDFSALSDLVHASPAYHDVYVANREAIWTTITLRELRTRGIDILKPTPFIEVRVRGNRFKGYLQPVLHS